MVEQKKQEVTRRRFLLGATAAAGLVATAASGLSPLGSSSSVAAAQAAADSSVSVSVPFGGFAAYSFQSDVANKKIGIKMTYSPTDPQDAGQANAKAVVLNVFAPGVSAAAGKPSGVAGGPAGNQHFQVASSASGEYVLVVHNWDSMKRTVSVTLSAAYVGGAALALKGVSGAAEPTQAPAAQTEVQQVSYPLPYTKLDPEVIRKEGHKAYYAGGCCYGAFHAIVAALRTEVGGPFNGIPTEMMKFGEGGGVGWGTLCGAINGSAAAMNMVLGKDDYAKLINELFGWAATAMLPTDISNQYAEEGKFLVETMKYDKALPQNVAHSPLCHASVTEWCQMAGVNVSNPQRLERCGRVTGDVAAQAVTLLNSHFDKTFTPTWKMDETSAGCVTCHSAKVHPEMGGVVNTKMECAPCHGEDPHKQ